MIAFTCFACPGKAGCSRSRCSKLTCDSVGMFNALSGIGGGGQVDATASNNGAVALVSPGEAATGLVSVLSPS